MNAVPVWSRRAAHCGVATHRGRSFCCLVSRISGGAEMRQASHSKRVRGYRIHIYRGARYQPPSITTPLIWREQPPIEEWQRTITNPASVSGLDDAIRTQDEAVSVSPGRSQLIMSKLTAHSDRTAISQEMPPCHTLSLPVSLLPERVSGRVAENVPGQH